MTEHLGGCRRRSPLPGPSRPSMAAFAGHVNPANLGKPQIAENSPIISHFSARGPRQIPSGAARTHPGDTAPHCRRRVGTSHCRRTCGGKRPCRAASRRFGPLLRLLLVLGRDREPQRVEHEPAADQERRRHECEEQRKRDRKTRGGQIAPSPRRGACHRARADTARRGPGVALHVIPPLPEYCRHGTPKPLQSR